MAIVEPRRDYSGSPRAQVDLDAMPLVKAAIDRGHLRRGDIERVVTLMEPEMLDEMAAVARSFQTARQLDHVRVLEVDDADLAERQDIACRFNLDLEDVV